MSKKDISEVVNNKITPKGMRNVFFINVSGILIFLAGLLSYNHSGTIYDLGAGTSINEIREMIMDKIITYLALICLPLLGILIQGFGYFYTKLKLRAIISDDEKEFYKESISLMLGYQLCMFCTSLMGIDSFALIYSFNVVLSLIFCYLLFLQYKTRPELKIKLKPFLGISKNN